MKPKNVYYAYVTNDEGASMDVNHSRGTSKAEAIAQTRRQFVPGWTAHIMCIYVDGDGKSVMGHEEVKTFRIKKG